MQEQIKALAKLDKNLGDKAEEVSHTINAALVLNIELAVLYAMCPAASVSGSLPALQAKGEIVRAMQEFYLQAAHIQIKLMPPFEFDTDFNSPQRRASGVCQLPGMLYCPEKVLFEITTRDGTKAAGVKGESETCVSAHWRYADARVKELR